jgi:hypothetical protein
MPATYEPIATTTLGTAAATITFSSIPATYTDLRLTLLVNTTSVDARNLRYTFNSDTGTNYSVTRLEGNGTSALSSRATSAAYMQPTLNTTTSSTIPTFYEMDVFSYAGSTNKTSLFSLNADKNGSGASGKVVGLWRSTAAINTIGITLNTGNFAAGTTATLYGIKNA